MSNTNETTGRRIVLLTSGGSYTEQVAVGCALRGIEIAAVLILGRNPQEASSLTHRTRTSLRRRARGTLAAGFGRLHTFFSDSSQSAPAKESPWIGLSNEVVSTGPINGPIMLKDLKALAPDYLILGDSGILSAEALEIPTIGTLNAHAAILPFARGVGVVPRSLQMAIPVGATLHFVDPGIDTGEVIRRELVPANEVESIISLKRKAYARKVELLVEATAIAYNRGTLKGTPQSIRFPYCRWPTHQERQDLLRKLRDGLARQLYREWFDFYGSNVLPNSTDPHPPIKVKPLSQASSVLPSRG